MLKLLYDMALHHFCQVLQLYLQVSGNPGGGGAEKNSNIRAGNCGSSVGPSPQPTPTQKDDSSSLGQEAVHRQPYSVQASCWPSAEC